MSKDITDYLPPPKEDCLLVQAKVPKSLRERVDSARTEDGYTWNDIIVAAMHSYLANRKKKRGAG